MINSASKKLSYLEKTIKNYLEDEEEILMILGKPLQSNKVLYGLIKYIICNKQGNVLYIWGNSNVDKRLISYIGRKEHKYWAYTKEDILDKRLVFMNYDYIYNINRKYDFIILDDITSYLNLSEENFRGVCEKLKKYSDKIIIYSPINYDKYNNIIAIRENDMIIEPRVITTRIDLKKDIPYFLYEYILWYRNNNKNVITYVPNKEDINTVYDYYKNIINLDGVKLIKSTDYKFKSNVFNIKDKSIFLITNNIGEVLKTPNVDGIIVLSADNKQINYKKILFMCSKVCVKHNEFAEVILVCNEETDNIEEARKITRSFNKNIWEGNYLSY